VGFLQIKSTGTADSTQRLSLYAWRLQEAPCLYSNSRRAQLILFRYLCSFPLFIPTPYLNSARIFFRGIMSHAALPATCCEDACVQTAGMTGEYAWMEKAPAALMPLMKACKRPSFPAPGEAGCL